jgi:hypothetical protein
VQALEKTILTNWVTLVFLLLFGIVYFLKVLNSEKLHGYISSFFYRGFVELETDQNTTLFNTFQLLIFIFSTAVLSITTYHFINYYTTLAFEGFYFFTIIFAFMFLFISTKWLLEYLLSSMFLFKNEVRFFFVSKSSYLYAISFLLFIALILKEYAQLSISFLTYFAATLFIIRIGYHAIKNKKLIFKQLFYFILYLCTFEIAPLFILFKLIF